MEQLKLNMIPNGVNPVFHASQYDKGRQIRFVLDETLSSAEVTVSYRAKDGTEYGNVQTSVSGNTITDTIPEEVLTDYGIIEGEVDIDGIGSLNFFVEVEKDAYDGGVITTQTASGAIATFETNIETAFVSLKSDINPVQDLHGYTKPWSGGGGKNKLMPTAGTTTINGITFTVDSEGVVKTSGTFSENTNLAVTTNFFLKAGTYILNGCPSGGSYSKYVVRIENGSAQRLALDTGSGEQFTLSEDTYVWCRIYLYSSDGIGKTFKPMVRLATESDSSFAPYENICPISGFSALNVTLADGDMQTVDTKTVNFGQTVYGGVADVTNGKVTLTHGIVDLGTLDWIKEDSSVSGLARVNTVQVAPLGAKYLQIPICTQYEGVYSKGFNAFNNGEVAFSNSEALPMIRARSTEFVGKTNAQIKALMSGVMLCFELETPIEITTTPENLTAISGENNVYSDTNGDTEVEYYIEV